MCLITFIQPRTHFLLELKMIQVVDGISSATCYSSKVVYKRSTSQIDGLQALLTLPKLTHSLTSTGSKYFQILQATMSLLFGMLF